VLAIHLSKMYSYIYGCRDWAHVLWQKITIIPRIHSTLSPPLTTPPTHKLTLILPKQHQNCKQDSPIPYINILTCVMSWGGDSVINLFYDFFKSFVVIYYNWSNVKDRHWEKVYRSLYEYHDCIVVISNHYIIKFLYILNYEKEWVCPLTKLQVWPALVIFLYGIPIVSW